MYQQAVSQANIVGLCVGTRPDCVPDAVLDLLCEYKDQGYEVWLELGYKPPTTKHCIASTAAMILPVISVQPSWHVSAG
ncbi:putative radical SAM protein [Escherichia coli]|uniref:Putative radical SAM protein n=1 Tax=Escherichia coli TaxID=562 RepID=A0A2X3JZT5_ECOLX|nr:putative radical SAM protein [Escherichia coli]